MSTNKITEININTINTKKLDRLEMGEAWMWCIDCNCKLYSFDGNQDATTKCPHPNKCKDLNDSFKNR